MPIGNRYVQLHIMVLMCCECVIIEGKEHVVIRYPLMETALIENGPSEGISSLYMIGRLSLLLHRCCFDRPHVLWLFKDRQWFGFEEEVSVRGSEPAQEVEDK